MNAHWYIAKYMPDLRRREPRNVGLVLFAQGQVLTRFQGQDPERDDEVDRRKVRFAASTMNYKSWVRYWTIRASECATRPDEFPIKRGGDNYFLDEGGRVVVSDRSIETLFEELYTAIVAVPQVERIVEQSVRPPTLVEQIVQELSPSLVIETDFVVRVGRDRLAFDFAVKQATNHHVFKVVELNGNPKRTWESVHAAAYSVETLAGSSAELPYALVVDHDPGPERDDQMETLRERLQARALEARDAVSCGYVVKRLVSPILASTPP
ncbi:MAG TPA: hypothetical protein VJV79_36780 [Polyangiaceae bacterium]|nr:hypothetical protein [Polyangiaceae bacterium]